MNQGAQAGQFTGIEERKPRRSLSAVVSVEGLNRTAH
jgi:hypothetical protein